MTTGFLNTADVDQAAIDRIFSILNSDFRNTGFQFSLKTLKRARDTLETNWNSASTTPYSTSEHSLKSAYGDHSSSDILNLYLVGPDVESFTTFPSDYDPKNPLRDGIVMSVANLPVSNDAIAIKRRLSHEIGHWLGLYDSGMTGVKLGENVGKRVRFQVNGIHLPPLPARKQAISSSSSSSSSPSPLTAMRRVGNIMNLSQLSAICLEEEHDDQHQGKQLQPEQQQQQLVSRTSPSSSCHSRLFKFSRSQIERIHTIWWATREGHL